jgi:hypothetical protein
MTIFVSIVSYRDAELVPTIKSVIDNADRPEDLYFGVVSQDDMNSHPDLLFVKNLSYTMMDASKSKGVGYARKKAMELYSGQDFYLQLDSHMRLASGWDSKLIDMYEWCKDKTGNPKIILSQFPAPYEVHTDGSIFYPKNHEELWERPSWSKVHNRDNGSWSAIRQEIKDPSSPHISETVLAGYLFAPADFISEIPYDERISFMGEELCIAVRAYTRGWLIYAPNEMLAWHYYKRKRSPKVWNQMEDLKRPLKWIDMEMQSKRVQKNILLGKEQGVFGIGDYSKYLEYQELIGINFSDFYDNVLHDKVNSAVRSTEIFF